MAIECVKKIVKKKHFFFIIWLLIQKKIVSLQIRIKDIVYYDKKGKYQIRIS